MTPELLKFICILPLLSMILHTHSNRADYTIYHCVLPIGCIFIIITQKDCREPPASLHLRSISDDSVSLLVYYTAMIAIRQITPALSVEGSADS